MRTLEYQGWHIEASSRALAAEWAPKALAWRERELHHYMLLRPDRPETKKTFPTEGEAETYAEQLARDWIDENG